MDDVEMTPFEMSLAGRLRAHSEIEVAPANPLALAREVMTTRRRSGLAASWASLRPPVRAAIALALLSSLLIGVLLVGSRLLQPPLTVTPTTLSFPSESATPLGGPAGADLRARWLSLVDSIPALGNGSGPVTLTIDPTGSVLSLANLAPGASFASTASLVASDQLRLVLIDAGGECEAGAESRYRMTMSSDQGRLTLEALSDECANRSLALSRTWDRTLVGPTTIGAGLIDSMEPNFAIRLPDDHYEARVLTDFIEIGGASGLSLGVLKNPQGFADSCSQDELRYPYTPGAAAFVEYYRQNDAFTVVEATPLTVDGNDAIHLVTRVRVEGARCPGTDLYAWTPRACDCHFLGADDSLYVVEVGSDTFLFFLWPAPDAATERSIMDSIRIPYQPGQASP